MSVCKKKEKAEVLEIGDAPARGSDLGLHAVAITVCIVFAVWVWMRDTTTQVGGDQTNIVTMIKAQEHPENFARDPFFKAGSGNFYPPLFRAIIGMCVEKYGILGGHRVMQYPLVLTYLLVMYGVLYALTRSTGAALLVSLLSSIRLNSLGGSYWGASELLTVQPRTFVVVCAPLLLLLAWRWRRSWWLVAPFAGIGLLMNVNPPGALCFAILLWFALLITHRSSEISIKVLTVAGVAFVVGSLPFAYAHIAARSAESMTSWPDVPEAVLKTIMQTSSYPITLIKCHYFFITFGPAFLLGTIGWVLRGQERGPLDKCLLVFFLLAAIGLVAAQAVMNQIAESTHRPSPILSVLRGQKHAYLILHIYSAYLVAKLLKQGKRWDRVAVVVVCLFVTFLGSPPYSPRNWDRSLDQLRALAAGKKVSGTPVALDAICKWAREETPKDSLFLLIHPNMHLFRMYAMRGLVVSRCDRGPVFYNGPDRATQWYRWYSAVRNLRMRPSLKALDLLVKDTRANYLAVPRRWPKLRNWESVHSDGYWTVYSVSPSK